MADAALEFLLENLKQLLIYHVHLIKDAKTQVENLENDLRLFRAFLNDSAKKRKRDESLQEIVRQIRDVVYEAEDVIDAFVTQAAETKTSSYFMRAFNSPSKLLDVANDVSKITKKVSSIYEKRIDFATLPVGGASEPAADDLIEEVKKTPLVRQDNIVGFEDEADTIINYLNGESLKLDVITIIGMPGLGKTTLAGKIFRDPKIQFEFPTRIWVFVSQEYIKRNVFLSILSNFIRITDDIHRKGDQEIAELLRRNLERGKFLIVMDDVWTPEAWRDLEEAFPKSNNRGKILVTSRNETVAWQANRDREPHKLRFLTPEESWLLLQLEVFGKPVNYPDLVVLGKLIVQQCGFLPLAIVVIGGTLVKKAAAGDMSSRINAWKKVSESVSSYLNDDQDQRMDKIISLSYNKLPYYLRPCYLYLGMFPEDFKIPVQKLTLMWIAEGFVQQKTGISLEETAHDYLEDLINRNLVMVDEMTPDGKIKTCLMHDMLREFCKNEAGNSKENFFQEMKATGGIFEPPISEVERYRRLCVHSNIVRFFSGKPCGHRVRSFVCFSNQEITLQPENTSSIPAAFKLLRVLEAKPLKFTKFPSDIKELVHLRYIALSCNFKILPDLISKLWNIQTLIINTTSRALEIKADIWKMVQLRHLKTNASTTLSNTGRKGKEGEKLQTLGTLSPQSCTEDVFDRARGLRELGIRGRIVTLLDAKGFEKLGNLEKLKLVNDAFPNPASEGRLPGLLQPYKFPPKLKSLTLSATFLEWRHMSTLGMLATLEVLKLKDNAFTGKVWEATDGGFRHLEVLLIERTNLVVWSASGHHFPRLRCLILRNCEKLDAIPLGLAESLQKMDLKRISKSAAESARRIEQAKKQQQGDEASKISGFKLIIAPGDE